MSKILMALLALALGGGAAAQAPSSPAKKELIAKVLQINQGGIEVFARDIVQRNTSQLLQGAANAMQQRVPPEKREALWQEIQADAQKFAEETFPIVRDRAVKLAPGTIGPMLDERFTEAELRQLITALENPMLRKYMAMGGELQRALGEKLMAEVRPILEPKVRALDQSVMKRLGMTPPPAGSASAPK